MSKLSLKELYFVNQFLVDKNATQAAIRSGYSPKTARTIAANLLAKVNVRKEVYRRLREQFVRLSLTSDAVISELVALAKINTRDAFNADGSLKPLNEIPEDLAKAISSIEINEITDEQTDAEGNKKKVVVGHVKKIKFTDKIRALEHLGRHLKLFTDLHAVVGSITHHHKISLEEVTDEHKRRVTSNLGIIQRYGAMGSGTGQN